MYHTRSILCTALSAVVVQYSGDGLCVTPLEKYFSCEGKAIDWYRLHKKHSSLYVYAVTISFPGSNFAGMQIRSLSSFVPFNHNIH